MDHLTPLPSAQAESDNVCDNICQLIKIHRERKHPRQCGVKINPTAMTNTLTFDL